VRLVLGKHSSLTIVDLRLLYLNSAVVFVMRSSLELMSVNLRRDDLCVHVFSQLPDDLHFTLLYEIIRLILAFCRVEVGFAARLVMCLPEADPRLYNSNAYSTNAQIILIVITQVSAARLL